LNLDSVTLNLKNIMSHFSFSKTVNRTHLIFGM
jgi:hypothetical protein